MKSTSRSLSAYFFSVTLCFSALASSPRFDYSPLSELLQTHVVDSGQSTKVRYAALKRDSKKLYEFNRTLSAVEISDFKKWNKNEQIAFLINSYNSFTLQLVVENYPVSSIKKIGGLFGNPWKKKFFRFLGEESNLDRIEHEILRKDYKEPRIHFAVNCASIGCPPLQKVPFEGAKLDEQLEAAARAFINGTEFNKFDSSLNSLSLSSIFKWYGSDFGDENHLRRFIANRMKVSQTSKEAIINSAKISYLDYDWNLNEAK